MWTLIATYEAKLMLFTRAALSSAKAVRLVHMLGLEKMDDTEFPDIPVLGPPTSFMEEEERRRVFWGAYAIDSHARISTGWPSLMRETDVSPDVHKNLSRGTLMIWQIITRLPASDDAFTSGFKEETAFLEEVFEGATFSGFAGTIVICQVFKLVLDHVHRSRRNDRPEDLADGPFWMRHRDLDNKLSSLFMFLPSKFRLPESSKDPMAVHTNLNLHASAICLHHAAIEQAEKHNLPASALETSVGRIRIAAEGIVSIIKMTSHMASMFVSISPT